MPHHPCVGRAVRLPIRRERGPVRDDVDVRAVVGEPQAALGARQVVQSKQEADAGRVLSSDVQEFCRQGEWRVGEDDIERSRREGRRAEVSDEGSATRQKLQGRSVLVVQLRRCPADLGAVGWVGAGGLDESARSGARIKPVPYREDLFVEEPSEHPMRGRVGLVGRSGPATLRAAHGGVVTRFSENSASHPGENLVEARIEVTWFGWSQGQPMLYIACRAASTAMFALFSASPTFSHSFDRILESSAE